MTRTSTTWTCIKLNDSEVREAIRDYIAKRVLIDNTSIELDIYLNNAKIIVFDTKTVIYLRDLISIEDIGIDI